MKLEEFKQTAQECENLGKELKQSDLDGCAGRIYLGFLWIQDLAPNGQYAATDPNPTQGRWHTIESNGEIRTNDLDQVERWLFDQRGLAKEELSAQDKYIIATNELVSAAKEIAQLRQSLAEVNHKLVKVAQYLKATKVKLV